MTFQVIRSFKLNTNSKRILYLLNRKKNDIKKAILILINNSCAFEYINYLFL